MGELAAVRLPHACGQDLLPPSNVGRPRRRYRPTLLLVRRPFLSFS
jgi:hypothetical protein